MAAYAATQYSVHASAVCEGASVRVVAWLPTADVCNKLGEPAAHARSTTKNTNTNCEKKCYEPDLITQ